MQSKFANQSQFRQYYVSNAVASARIEGITPTKQLEQNLTDYFAGKKVLCKYWTKQSNAIPQIDLNDVRNK
jgi:Antitoxin VbhA